MAAEWIWRNGEFVRWEDANVHVTTHALHYGSSVFEGIRAYSNTRRAGSLPAPVITLKRLAASAAKSRASLCRLPPSRLDRGDHRGGGPQPVTRPATFGRWRFRGALAALGCRRAASHPVDSSRPSPWNGALTWGQEAIDNGVDVQVSSWRRMAPDTHRHRWPKLAASTSTASL
jgi:branched-chain amino acid aminotransferase